MMAGHQPRWPFYVGAVVLFCLLLIIAFGTGRCSVPPSPAPDLGGIDAGPAEEEIAARVDAAVQAEEARLEELERRYETELRGLNERERREYEKVRAHGREALAAWLSERSRLILLDGGTVR